MKKGLVLVIAVLNAFLVGHQTFALTDDEIQKSIQSILNVRHPQDDRHTWEALGATAPKVIISMFQSSRSVYDKIRLINGLAWFDDASAIAFLKKEAKENNRGSWFFAYIMDINDEERAKVNLKTNFYNK